jgi:putative membrane-bound dehydrogenase-like protein
MYPFTMRCLMLLTVLLTLGGCTRGGPPYSPKEALQTFKIEPGFRIEPYIAEPDIRSPVAMEFDENGRIYVVENPGYPLNVEGKVGRVILLEDTDGNGRPDRRTVFADKLTLPTGVMRWKKGVLVTDAPDILYFEDTDGNGTAEIRRVVLTGFAFTNPQHTVNSPIYGLDNWIYLAHEGPATAIVFPKEFGDRGGNVRFPDRPDAPSLEPARRMIRFRPDSGQLEYLSTSTQFGHSFDAWGHHFTVSNEDHIRQEVVRASYLTRNPHLPISSAMARISDHRPAADVYPITRRGRVEMLSGIGSFTSACGITMYLGGAFPPSLGLFALVAEPAQNLVHRDVLTPSGATFVAKRAREEVEFLASTDAWFRPVNFYVGPDGAIYLVDYYRLMVEHPEWTATHTHHSPDLYEGEDRGRIYRISPESPLPLPGRIRLGEASTGQLVQMLASPNIWWRRTAQRLIVDRGSADAAALVTQLFESSQSSVARLHALWTLDGLNRLETHHIERALDDPEAGVRENAILLAEPRLRDRARIVDKLLNMETDPDGRVQFQLLSTLGDIDSPHSRATQQRLLANNIDDPWMQIAALSASSDRAQQLFGSAAAFTRERTDARARLFQQIGTVIGARRKPVEVRQVLTTLLRDSNPRSSWWRAATLDGLAQGLGTSRQTSPPGTNDARGNTNLGADLLLTLFDRSDAEVRRASLRVLAATGLPPSAAPLLRRATATAQAGDKDPALRADSIGLLALGLPQAYEALFKTLVDAKEPEPVQVAAARALGRLKGGEIGSYLIARWKSMTPAVRMEAADAMFLDPERPKQLLEAIRAGTVQPWTLQFRHRRQLLMSRDVALRDAARALLEEKAGDRDEVLKRYQAALEKDGDPKNGRVVFERVCAKCHKLNGLGNDVGPDLATIRNRTPEQILPDIIMPSRSIAQNYESYVVETKSRGIIAGVMGAQTPTTITIRHEGAAEDVIRREDITDIRITDLSAMPADVDKLVTVDEMADLLEFLKTIFIGGIPARTR